MVKIGFSDSALGGIGFFIFIFIIELKKIHQVLDEDNNNISLDCVTGLDRG